MKKLFALAFLFIASTAIAVDPPWTQQYLYNQSPEANGFTRTLQLEDGTYVNPGDPGAPVVTEVTGGNPSQRRVEIEGGGGGAIFHTSNVPDISPGVGITLEWRCSTTGDGSAWGSVKFNDRVLHVGVFQAKLYLAVSGTYVAQRFWYDTADNSAQTTWRVTYSPDSTVHVYRDAVLVAGPVTVTNYETPTPQVSWGGEGAGTYVFTALRWYQGGAVAP